MQLQSPFGVKILNSILAAEFNSTVVEFIVPETNGYDFFINDVVSGINQTDDEGIQYCERSVPGQSIRGTIIGFDVASRNYENEIYRKGGTRRTARVCQDPFIRCKVLVNDIVQDIDIGKTLNIDSASGNTSTGTSEVQLDYSTLIHDGGQFRIQKILKKLDTSSDPFFPEKYTIIECIIANHELLASNIVSSGLWDRIGTTLIPNTPSDEVNVGGGLVDGDVTIPVLIGDASNTTFDTINQTIIGAVNEIFNTPVSSTPVDKLFTIPFDGAINFSLDSAPISDAAFRLYLNGQLRLRGTDYTRSGVLIVWLNPAGLTLKTTDELFAVYNDATGVPTATTKELWMLGTDYNVNFSNYRVRSITGTGTHRFSFHIPDDFASLVKLKLVGIITAGAAGAGKDIDLTSDYGANGQAYNFYSESDTLTSYDFTGWGNQVREVLDLSIVMSNIAAGQYCGILVDHNSIGGTINYIGIELVYTTA